VIQARGRRGFVASADLDLLAELQLDVLPELYEPHDLLPQLLDLLAELQLDVLPELYNAFDVLPDIPAELLQPELELLPAKLLQPSQRRRVSEESVG
jgi:hypothetical protein